MAVKLGRSKEVNYQPLGLLMETTTLSNINFSTSTNVLLMVLYQNYCYRARERAREREREVVIESLRLL